jgi:ankyrin repeat protein
MTRSPLFVLLTLWVLQAHAYDFPQEFAGFERPSTQMRGNRLADPDMFTRAARTPNDWAVSIADSRSLLLLSAARRGDWQAAIGYLKQGANANVVDAAGDGSVLALAAADAQAEVVRRLIAAGADLDRRGEDGFTPLGAAALRGHLAVVRQLVNAGADPDRKSANGAPPIVDAVRLDHLAVVDVLLAGGADPTRADRDGHHALSMAAARGTIGLVRHLLARGLDPDASDGKGRTALFWARLYGRESVVATLIAAGADETATVPRH